MASVKQYDLDCLHRTPLYNAASFKKKKTKQVGLAKTSHTTPFEHYRMHKTAIYHYHCTVVT